MSARRWIVRIAAGVTLGYVLWLAFLLAFQEMLIFPGAYLPAPAEPLTAAPPAEDVWLTVEPGIHVQGWYQAGRGRSPESPGPAVLFLHGNADRIETRWNVSQPYVERGLSFLICEYRGYGHSGGRPSEGALVGDAVRFRDWLAARPEVDPDRIVLHGISVGGGVAVGVAAQRRPAAVVLESTFTSISALCRRYGAPALIVRHPFRSDEVLRKLDVPVMLVHGSADVVIPIEHARELSRICRNATLVESTAGHGDYRTEWDGILRFLAAQGLLPM
jgi:pimeloyl-ACP methyl ester carboxylesterase